MLEVSNQEKLIARLFKDTLIIFLLSMFAEKAGTLIDGMITGKFLGTEAIAAFGLTAPYQKFAVIFTVVMALGMKILCGKTLGTGNLREANGIFSLAVTAVVTVAIVLLVGTNLFTGQIVDLLGVTTDNDLIRAQAIDYLKSYSFALPPLALMSIFTPIMQFDNDRNRAVLAVTVMSICNVAGDLINIFVVNGGLFGIGIATAISYWIAAGYLYLHFVKPEANFKFSPAAVNVKFFRKMFLNGSPMTLIYSSLTLRREFLNRLAMLVSGGTGLAAYTIMENFAVILEVFSLAASSSVQMLGGIFIGERDRNSARKLLKVALRWTFMVTPLLTIISFVAAPLIAEIYTQNDSETCLLAAEAIRWYSLRLPLYTASLLLQCFYQAYGRFRLVSFLSVWNIFLFSVPVAYLLSKKFGIDGLWFTLFISQFASWLVIFIKTCRHCGRITFRPEDYLLLPADFDVDESNQLNITVTNKAEVLGLSERTQNFCLNHDIDFRRSMFAGICIEEMAGNIVDYGFNDGKNHFVDVRIIVKDSQVTIRIRDDCRSFDPKKWAEIHNSDDPTANIGIRLVSKIATEFDYVNVLKLNNLIIKI